MRTILQFVFWSCFIEAVRGHGYMKDPLSRGAANNPNTNKNVSCNTGDTNYTPWGANCGGAYTQNKVNGGKCGACGDNYRGTRDHEYGGRYATSIKPTRIYLEGELIETEVVITAEHKGAFVFKLCDILQSDPNQGGDALTNCFEMASALPGEDGQPLSIPVTASTTYRQKVKLPDGFTCPRGCTMQWFYKAGNNYGSDQEHFVNCADIAIVSCMQYQTDNYEPNWCGYGPTDAVKKCKISDSGSGGSTGSTGGSTSDGSTSGGSTSDGSTSGGGTSDGSTSDGSTGEQCPDDGTASKSGKPSCNACTTAQSSTCEDNCCSKGEHNVYLSTITQAPDMWCQTHCTQKPPFCPAMYCEKYAAIHWVNECTVKKSLNTIMEKIERKAVAHHILKQKQKAKLNRKKRAPAPLV